MWEPFRLSIEQWAPQCKIVDDKFHIMQHGNDAIGEVRKAVLSARSQEAGSDQREEVVADESLEEPDAGTPRGIEPVVRTEPSGL
jgi:transposase